MDATEAFVTNCPSDVASGKLGVELDLRLVSEPELVLLPVLVLSLGFLLGTFKLLDD